MKNFKAKIDSIHEDLKLRRSLEIEEDKTPTFDDKDWILRDVYGHIKRTIETFYPEEEDQVNHLMAGLKQAADQIESRYTGSARTTFFNAAEDAEGTEKSWWVVKAKVVPNPDYSGPPKAHATHVEVTAPIHANDEAIIAKIEDQYPQHKVVEIDKYESSYDRGQEFRRG